MGLLRMKLFVKLIMLASAVGILLVCLYKTQGGKRFIVWGVKKSFMFALDDKQFKTLYDGRCLVQNAFVKTEIDEGVCELCENTRLLQKNVAMREEIMDMLQWDIPVVVNNSTYPFGMDLMEFVDSFLLSRDLALFQPCQFKSNIKSKVREHRQLVQMVSRGKVASFYSLWENCADISLKAFRQFYTRPSFLGNNVQLTGTNWALICLDYESKSFKDIETFSQLVIVFVQKGTIEVRLSPAKVCANLCATISINLISGDTLLFSGNMYSLSMRPGCYGKETVVIGVGGYFD